MNWIQRLIGKKQRSEAVPDQLVAPPRKDEWIIAKTADDEGKSEIFRYRAQKPEDWQSAPLSEEVSITWEFEGEFPHEEEQERMAALEDALDPLWESAESVQMLTITRGRQREWCFYTRDYDNFMAVLNRCLAGKPRFPIAIVHSHDPEWKYWHGFVDPLNTSR